MYAGSLPTVAAATGRLDILVANHAYMVPIQAPLLEHDEQTGGASSTPTSVARSIWVQVLPHMRAVLQCRIVAITSEVGCDRLAGQPRHAAAKSGLISLVKSLGQSWAPGTGSSSTRSRPV